MSERARDVVRYIKAIEDGDYIGEWFPTYGPDGSVFFGQWLRHGPDLLKATMLDVLNGPSFNESTPERDATTIPTQAFAMLNSSFANHRALALAARARIDRHVAERVEPRGLKQIDLQFRCQLEASQRRLENQLVGGAGVLG